MAPGQGGTMVNHSESLVSESTPPVKGEGVFRAIMQLLQKKKVIAVITLAGTVLGVVLSLLLPVQYTASTLIVPPQQSGSLSSLMLGQLGMFAGLGRDLGLKSPLDQHVAMLSSETVETGLIKRFNLMQLYKAKSMASARRTLEAHTIIKPLVKQGVIRISIVDSDAKRAADLANGYIEQLHVLSQMLANQETSERRQFFANQLQKAKENLATAEQEMKQTQEKTGLLQLDAQSRTIISAVASLRAQISVKQVQLQTMRSYATEKNPDYVLVEQQLVGLREELAKLLHSHNVSEGDIEIPTAKVPEVGLAYIRAYRNFRYHEAVYEIIARQFEGAKLDEAKSVAFAQVIDPATVPEERSAPRRRIIVMGMFMFSFVLGCAFVFVQDAYVRFMADPLHREWTGLLKIQIRRSFWK